MKVIFADVCNERFDRMEKALVDSFATELRRFVLGFNYGEDHLYNH